MAYSCCFGLRGNVDFPDFLQKSFITSTNVHRQCDQIKIANSGHTGHRLLLRGDTNAARKASQFYEMDYEEEIREMEQTKVTYY